MSTTSNEATKLIPTDDVMVVNVEEKEAEVATAKDNVKEPVKEEEFQQDEDGQENDEERL